MNQSIVSQNRWSIALAPGTTRVGYANGARGGRGKRALRGTLNLLDDAVFLLLAVLLLPVAILAVGTPLALLVTLLLEIAKRI